MPIINRCHIELGGSFYRAPLKIHSVGWQAGHGDAKHLGRAGLLLRAPALGGLRPTVSRGHRKEPHSE
jgi:hypothetical protein